MWHTASPSPQALLATTYCHILLELPTTIFVPFLRAFYLTIGRQWPLIDSLRMDKFLLLTRKYINASFQYLAKHGWDNELVQDFLLLMEEVPLSASNKNTGDGIRYHMLDCWLVELNKIVANGENLTENQQCPTEKLLRPLWRLREEGRTKAVRQRARECLGHDGVEKYVPSRKDNETSSNIA